MFLSELWRREQSFVDQRGVSDLRWFWLIVHQHTRVPWRFNGRYVALWIMYRIAVYFQHHGEHHSMLSHQQAQLQMVRKVFLVTVFPEEFDPRYIYVHLCIFVSIQSQLTKKIWTTDINSSASRQARFFSREKLLFLIPKYIEKFCLCFEVSFLKSWYRISILLLWDFSKKKTLNKSRASPGSSNPTYNPFCLAASFPAHIHLLLPQTPVLPQQLPIKSTQNAQMWSILTFLYFRVSSSVLGLSFESSSALPLRMWKCAANVSLMDWCVFLSGICGAPVPSQFGFRSPWNSSGWDVHPIAGVCVTSEPQIRLSTTKLRFLNYYWKSL